MMETRALRRHLARYIENRASCLPNLGNYRRHLGDIRPLSPSIFADHIAGAGCACVRMQLRAPPLARVRWVSRPSNRGISRPIWRTERAQKSRCAYPALAGARGVHGTALICIVEIIS